MKISMFWYCIAMGIMISIIYSQKVEINELSGFVTDLREITDQQNEVVKMSNDYIKRVCRK